MAKAVTRTLLFWLSKYNVTFDRYSSKKIYKIGGLKLGSKIFSKVSFYFMSKGLNLLLKKDGQVKERLSIIPDNTIMKIAILGEKENLLFKKIGDNLLICKNCDSNADLTITFKFFKSLTNIVFGKISVTNCYLNDEFFVQGELRYAVSIVFAIEKFMAYLLSKKQFIKKYGFVPNNAVSKSNMFMHLLFGKRGKVWKIVMNFIIPCVL